MKTSITTTAAVLALTSSLMAQAEQNREPAPQIAICREAVRIVPAPEKGVQTASSHLKELTNAEATDSAIQSLLDNEDAKTTLDKLKAPLIIKSLEDSLKHLSRASIEAIAEDVDFDTQQIMIFAWSGSGQDRLTFRAVNSQPVRANITYTPGNTKDLQQHVKIVALPNDAKWTIFQQKHHIIRCGVGAAPEIKRLPNGIQLKGVDLGDEPRPIRPRARVE